MSDAVTRLLVFVFLFVALAMAEVVSPRRPQGGWRRGRWFTNVALSIANTALVTVLTAGLGIAAVLAAIDAEASGIGLFNRVDWPRWLEGLLCFILLDLAIWLQHVLFHKIPVLWRVHRVHHADPHTDVTTGVRFHPAEIALSLLIKGGVVYALGAPVIAVLAFEVALMAGALFSHANVHLPEDLDRALRRLIVTPDMHRIHHSIDRREQDTNFGFCFSVWDRVFRTYAALPRGGHGQMRVGLDGRRGDAPRQLVWSLMLPFRR